MKLDRVLDSPPQKKTTTRTTKIITITENRTNKTKHEQQFTLRTKGQYAVKNGHN